MVTKRYSTSFVRIELFMIRITKETEYAFLLLSTLLESDEIMHSANSLAELTGIAAPVSGKVLKRLVREGVLISTRGAYGGYQLAREAENITALDVVKAIEGQPELVDCAHSDFDCAFADHCRISPFWRHLNDEITAMLKNRTLSDMLSIERAADTRKPKKELPS